MAYKKTVDVQGKFAASCDSIKSALLVSRMAVGLNPHIALVGTWSEKIF